MSDGGGMMVVNVWLMMRLVMRGLIVMILWRLMMIGHVRSMMTYVYIENKTKHIYMTCIFFQQQCYSICCHPLA